MGVNLNININGLFSNTDKLPFSSLFRKKNYQQELISFLFFNNGVNQFNVLPKLMLYKNFIGKQNNLRINHLKVVVEIIEGEGEKCNAVITWTLRGLCNETRHKITEFYFYTGIDFGEYTKKTVTLSNGKSGTKFDISDISSSNGIYLYEWGLLDGIAKNKLFDEMVLQIDLKEAFDFRKQDIIYLFPPNFGNKIEKIELVVQKKFEKPNIKMEFREVGRDNRNKISDRIIQTSGYEHDDFHFALDSDEIKMNNVYYLRINPQKIDI
ncbi:MAG: hypothetical protein J1E64_15025 [Acetatifactor sp.]|nr:hypothetical protein [Acetatifactor sp.]